MPRALLLCEYPALNGGERSLLAVLPTLQQAGWEFDAWCPGVGPLADSLTSLGVRVFAQKLIVERANSLEQRRADLAAVLALGSKCDLVHANSLSMGRLSGPVVEAAGVPSISHLRDIIALNRAAITDLSRHTRLLAVSDAARKHHLAQGLAAEKCETLYNGIDTERFRPLQRSGYLHRELGIERYCRMIGVVGQIILRKGLDTALAAMLRRIARWDDEHVVVVGARHSEKPETIEYERSLHDIVASVGLTSRVHFLGTRDDMPRLLRELSLLVHAARQEPLGRVLLETAACAVPIVTTDVGGTREIFPRGELDGAFLVPVDDVDAIENRINRVLDDDVVENQTSAYGRARITAVFSVERSAAGLLRHYTEVAAV
jgi:glycosyltransferase involved in cell wall biosynthesis